MTVGSVHYYEDVIKHNTKDDCWVLISGQVYDVSTFLDDHPGGDEVLLTASGKDATIDFEDVGHSDDAKDLMSKYCIGEVDRGSLPVKQEVGSRGRAGGASGRGKGSDSPGGGFAKTIQLLMPLLILVFALALRQYKKND